MRGSGLGVRRDRVINSSKGKDLTITTLKSSANKINDLVRNLIDYIVINNPDQNTMNVTET